MNRDELLRLAQRDRSRLFAESIMAPLDALPHDLLAVLEKNRHERKFQFFGFYVSQTSVHHCSIAGKQVWPTMQLPTVPGFSYAYLEPVGSTLQPVLLRNEEMKVEIREIRSWFGIVEGLSGSAENWLRYHGFDSARRNAPLPKIDGLSERLRRQRVADPSGAKSFEKASYKLLKAIRPLQARTLETARSTYTVILRDATEDEDASYRAIWLNCAPTG